MAVAADNAMPVEPEIHDRSSLGGLLSVLRRYWWVIALALALCLSGAAAAAAAVPTTYIGRSSLIVASNNRSPDQDAVLVQGYVAYFDDAAYQSQLLAQAQIHSSSSVAAQTAASSPILVVTATALDPVAAQANAVAVATAFSDDINETHARATAAALATAQDQLDTALSRNARQDQAVIGALQDRIRDLQADQVNVLQVLQLQGGVSSQGPPWMTNAVLGGAGGLVLGVLAALLLNATSARVRSRDDLAHKVGLATLAELPEAPGAARTRRVRQLGTLLRARLHGAGVVAVAQPAVGPAAAAVAHELAVEWALQGFRTVLVRLDAAEPGTTGEAAGDQTPPPHSAARPGRLVRGPVDGMSLLRTTDDRAADGAGLPAAAVPGLLELDELAGAIVVVEAADVVGSATAQVAAGAADLTVLVVDPKADRLAESREAVVVLRDGGATLLGAVLAPTGARAAAAGRHGGGRATQAPEAPVDGDPGGPSPAWYWRSAESGEESPDEGRAAHHNGTDVAAVRSRSLVTSDQSHPDPS